MRQASWEELWRAKAPAPVEEKPPWWSRFAIFSWEELITLIIVMLAFITIVQSIDSANWVPEMPSLYNIAFLGLLTGLGLSRIHLNELLLHVAALAIGVAGVVITASAQLSGSPADRTTQLADRVQLWAEALLSGGISNDNLPFVVLVVGLTYLTAYLSAWAIFHWYNAWIGLIPGGIALLTNISYLPGQRSFSLIIYLFCAILLVARVNVLRHARDWKKQRTAYPDLISLHVLNVTTWVALLLLAAAWILPIGSGGGLFLTVWQKVTAPIAGPVGDLGRVFAAIDSKKGGTVHRFGSTLPLQGEISLGGEEVMQVTATETGFLRAQSYDFYTAQGWKIGASSQITSTPWPALKPLQGQDDVRRQTRRAVSIQVTTSKKSGVLVSAGQPQSVNVDSRIVFGPDQSDVTSIRPTSRLNDDAQYRVDSTLTNAAVGRLRSAPTTYPAWISAYLQLPPDLPRSIRLKAVELTAAAGNSYDKAVQIERFLRSNYAVDTKIGAAPPKRDSVEYFLFSQYRGYFDYHASAMVVMLRALGVPARLAVGYIIRPQDKIPDSNTYIVSEGNAFAWPEVYFPGLGWVEFNPTPSEPPIRRSGGDDQEVSDTFDENLTDDEDDEGLAAVPADPAASQLDRLRVDEGTGLVGKIILGSILAFLAITVTAGGLFQYSWRHGLAGLDYPVQTWEKTLRLARWARIRPLPQETPRDIVSRLRRELPEVDDIDYLGESFLRSRYGRKELGQTEKERLASVWKGVRNTLLQRILRWK